MQKTVLILGASGRLGRNAATAFAVAGWDVRRFDRRTDNLQDAAGNAAVIVNGWNPPYHKWADEVPKLTARVIEAAKISGATVIQPGNVYGYGPDAPELFGPDTPCTATNPLGRIRIEMERALRVSGVQTIVVRAGDYIDTEASGNWFDLFIAKRAAKGRLVYPGPLDTVHAWAFLPDVAQVMVAMAERRDTLGQWTDMPVPGYAVTGRELAESCARALGHPVRIKRMSWLLFRLARPFVPIIGGLLEMRYLWEKPHRLDPEPLARICPEIEMTPLTEALRTALEYQIDPDKPMRTGGKTVVPE